VVGTLGVVAGNTLGLKVVDVANPEKPRVVGTLAGTVKGAAVAGRYAYVILVVPGNPARIDLAIVDLQVPSSPGIVGRVTVPGGVHVAVDGAFAYVASAQTGLQIVDVSSPTAPRLVAAADTSGSAQAVAVAAGYAYVADNDAIVIVDVRTPTRPAVVSRLATPATAIAVANRRAYVIGGLQLKVVDVANPAAPVLSGSSSAYGAQAVAVLGSLAFLATPAINHFDTSGGVYVLDVANPAQMRLTKQLIVPGTTRTVTHANGYVYVGDSAAVLDVIDVLP
jgi:hypothetical protein